MPVPERNTRSRRRIVQDDDDDDGDEQHVEQNEEEQEEENTASAKTTKRRRVNDSGHSVPTSRAPTEEQEEGEQAEDGEDDDNNEATQKPKPEFKTLPRDEDGYIPGSIVRVQLKNFVTYDYVEFRPGPYLNMIIGPNGSGKSSIACAICIGLNFPPSLLGRAGDIGSYVKIGTKTGYTEIELKGPKGQPNLVIKRKLTAESKSSAFELNGKSVTGQQIKQKMMELNVQVGNLCTFLPQDKVSSFASMTPQELLRETQRAAGDSRLTQWHESLISLGKEFKELEAKQETDVKARDHNQQRVDTLEHNVRAFRERQEREKQRAILECIIPVERYRVKHAEYLKLKKSHREIHKHVMRLKEKNAPAHELLKRLREEGKELELELKECQRSQVGRVKKCGEVFGTVESFDTKLEQIHTQFEQLQRDEKAALHRIKATEAEITRLEKEVKKPVEDVDDPEVLKDQEKQANLEKMEVDQKDRDLKREFQVHIDQRARAKVHLEEAQKVIQSFNNLDNVKLANMQRWHKDTHDAILWLRQNQDKFKMRVFEPAFMCMTVPDARYMDGVESLINSAQLRTFVAQCKDDVNTLNKAINDNPGLGRRARIVTWYRDYNEGQLALPPMSREEMNQLGFDGYALDYVDCPDGLKWFLKRECNFHRNAIALNARNIDVSRAMEAVARPDRGGGATFVIGNVLNTVQRSRYGSRAVNNTTRDVQRARNLAIQTVDPETRKHAEQAVSNCEEQLELFEEQRRELDKRLAEIKVDDEKVMKVLDGIRRKRAKIREAQKNRVANENRLRRLQGELVTLKNRPSEEQTKKKLNKQLMQLNFQKAEKLKDLAKYYKTLLPEQQEQTRLVLQMLQLNANIEALDELCKRKDARYNAALTRFNEINERFNAVRHESKEVLEEAKTAVSNCPEDAAEEATRINQGRKEYYENLEKWENAIKKYDGDEDEIKKEGIGKPDKRKIEEEDKIDLRGLEELVVALEQVNIELEMDGGKDLESVRQYEEKKKAIETLEASMADRQKKIDRTHNQIRRTRNEWEPLLRALIVEIRNKFSTAFDRIGCAGDVELVTDPDYEKWRVDIKVKFRDSEKLQLLTGQRQSGGERSLTTILYLMSLTSLAHTPFSLVDEINQGMDKRAERMVHNSMVDVTCGATGEDSSQYFLITPKLLPDLKYHKRMKVHCVFNGEWVPEQFNGDMGAMLRNYMRCKGLDKFQRGRGSGSGSVVR